MWKCLFGRPRTRQFCNQSQERVSRSAFRGQRRLVRLVGRMNVAESVEENLLLGAYNLRLEWSLFSTATAWSSQVASGQAYVDCRCRVVQAKPRLKTHKTLWGKAGCGSSDTSHPIRQSLSGSAMKNGMNGSNPGVQSIYRLIQGDSKL